MIHVSCLVILYSFTKYEIKAKELCSKDLNYLGSNFPDFPDRMENFFFDSGKPLLQYPLGGILLRSWLNNG